MVRGIDSFRDWFRGYEDQYVIIGGTACDLLMTEEGLDFRATKDIDLVLIVEAGDLYLKAPSIRLIIKSMNLSASFDNFPSFL